MEEYFKIIRYNYKQQRYYRSMAYDWLFQGCFTRMHVMIKSMYDWINKFYNLAGINFNEKEIDDINSTLQHFNKDVIKEIENYRIKMSGQSGTKVNFNQAAMKWIDNEYKSFKKKWFKENSNISFEKLFQNGHK